MYGENHFISEYESGTDGYYCDTLHYQYPDKGYEQIEEQVMAVSTEYELVKGMYYQTP
jgi:hypothetical protein